MLIRLRTVAVSGAVIVAVGLSGCVPVAGRQDPVRISVARFMDGVSRAAISEALVVPSFTVYTGLTTGHGSSGGMSESVRLADARVQRSGEALTLDAGSVLGIWWAFVAVSGRYSNLGPVLVVAPGYRPRSVAQPWAKGAFEPLVLEPVLPQEAIAELEQIGRLLNLDTLTPDDAARLGIRSGQPVGIQLSRGERETIRAFVSAGLAGLRANTR